MSFLQGSKEDHSHLRVCSNQMPIISTDVGIAKEILSSSSIFNMENGLDAKTDVDYAIKC